MNTCVCVCVCGGRGYEFKKLETYSHLTNKTECEAGRRHTKCCKHNANEHYALPYNSTRKCTDRICKRASTSDLVLGYLQTLYEEMFINGGLAGTWKEPIVTCFKVLTERNNKNTSA